MIIHFRTYLIDLYFFGLPGPGNNLFLFRKWWNFVYISVYKDNKEVYYACASTSWFQLLCSLKVTIPIHLELCMYELKRFTLHYLFAPAIQVRIIYTIFNFQCFFLIEKHLVWCKCRGCSSTLNKLQWKLFRMHMYI